jgi:hypothetical protein
MARSSRWRRVPRALLTPIGATGTIVAIALVAGTAGAVAGPAGFVLAWLLVGLVAGYALSGSV